jgi:hypothetical protein
MSGGYYGAYQVTFELDTPLVYEELEVQEGEVTLRYTGSGVGFTPQEEAFFTSGVNPDLVLDDGPETQTHQALSDFFRRARALLSHAPARA